MSFSLIIPKLSTKGVYTLKGKVLNVEGLDSKGPYQLMDNTFIYLSAYSFVTGTSTLVFPLMERQRLRRKATTLK